MWGQISCERLISCWSGYATDESSVRFRIPVCVAGCREGLKGWRVSGDECMNPRPRISIRDILQVPVELQSRRGSESVRACACMVGGSSN